MIEIRNLHKSFSGKQILKNVNLRFGEDKIIGILGKSGIGKSTIAKILCGVLTPDEGEIYIDGKPLYTPRTGYNRSLGLQIQMVYQQPHAALDPSQKILAGFLEAIRYHKFAAGKNEAMALIRRLISEVNIDEGILYHLPHQISGGEAQRIALARCLMYHPRFLIMDEATSMLDVSTRANVFGLVRRIAQKERSTLLVISHDRELVNYLCNEIYEFNEEYNLKEIEKK